MWLRVMGAGLGNWKWGEKVGKGRPLSVNTWRVILPSRLSFTQHGRWISAWLLNSFQTNWTKLGQAALRDDTAPSRGIQGGLSHSQRWEPKFYKRQMGSGSRGAELTAWPGSHQVHEYSYRAHLLSIYMRNFVLEAETMKVKKTQPFLPGAHRLTDWWGRQSHANYKL